MSGVVALLRGVNVGGKQVSMPRLRAILETAGFTDVRTYLNSGNVVLESEDAPGVVAAGVEDLITEHLGMSVRVIARTDREMALLGAHHPLSDHGLDPRFLHVVFLEKAPERGTVASLDPERSPDDRFQVTGRELYVAYGQGQGRSKLTLDYFERTLGVAGTARNWNTVRALAVMVTG